MRKLVLLLTVFSFFLSADRAAAGGEDHSIPGIGEWNVPYIGAEMGLSLAGGVKLDSTSSGVPTKCDLHFNSEPGFHANASDFLMDTDNNCAQATGDSWENDFNKTSIGHTAGLVVGLKKIAGLPVRAEAEYIYRNNEYDKRANWKPKGEQSAAKLAEFDGSGSAYATLTDSQAHSLFVNVYYDYETATKVTPYLGIGGGWAKTKYGISHFFVRDDDVDPDAVQNTVSYINSSFEDDLFGFQILTGFDYDLGSKMSVGLKLRWSWFGEFEGEARAWDKVRSHSSTIAPPDSDDADELAEAEPPVNNNIVYKPKTKDTSFWGAAISLKYHIR